MIDVSYTNVNDVLSTLSPGPFTRSYSVFSRPVASGYGTVRIQVIASLSSPLDAPF